MIAQDIVREALEEIGAYSPFEQQGGADFDLGFRRLNAMLDSWKIERLLIDHQVRSEFNLLIGYASIAIGSGATWDVPRPDFIAAAGFVDTSAIERPIAIIDDAAWAGISNKLATSNRPLGLRYEKTMTPTLGSGTIYPWPVPTENGTIALYIPTTLAEVASLNTTLYLPPGVRKALYLNLALDLAPSFGKTPAQRTVDEARRTRAVLKSVNSAPPRISLETVRMTSDRVGGISLIDFTTRNF